jgi:peptidoglycan hydrolase-like amidase
VTGPTGKSADLELRVPGRIVRWFHGRLDVTAVDDELVPVVSMDLETAVASVVAAEQIRSAPPEALKAQAVAARSFFAAAGRRHRGFDFCDTTHCQFIREPPAADHPAAHAARATAGLVLTFRGAPIEAFYSASCGGRTRTLADAGLQAADGYPYFSVDCAYCVRRHTDGDRNGHGVGLCQEGAAGMATERGASFVDILQHYYPGTTLQMRSP